MAGSLQDQLLGAGLINKKKARKITLAQQQTKKKNRKAHIEVENEAAVLAKKATEEERRRSQELNKQHKQEAEKKAISAQIHQIIEMNSIEIMSDDGALVYNFSDENKIKNIQVSSQQHELISNGKLAIAKKNNIYYLIPKVAAKKIIERDDSFIILLNDAQQEQQNEDDPYADYQVPDDLMW